MFLTGVFGDISESLVVRVRHVAGGRRAGDADNDESAAVDRIE